MKPAAAYHQLKNIIFPPVCPVCRDRTTAACDSLCTKCEQQLHIFSEPRCTACGGTVDGVLDMCSECLRIEERNWDYAVSVFPFRGVNRKVIHRLKYSGQAWLAPFLGERMAREWMNHGKGQADAIVPVPLHPIKHWRRGYNQARLLAEEVSRYVEIPVEVPLARWRLSKPQACLTKQERRKNTQNLFQAKRRADFSGKHIVIIDDVLTTGATLQAAVDVLKRQALASRVSVLTAARG